MFGRHAIHAADGTSDTIDCGGGHDTVKADPDDRLSRCERAVLGVFGGGDITTSFINGTPWQIQWVSVDEELHGADSVDHPSFPPYGAGWPRTSILAPRDAWRRSRTVLAMQEVAGPSPAIGLRKPCEAVLSMRQ
jgi:hypothetical protein